MKILMIGWEFPPFFAGGLGMVCYELTKTLKDLGEDITYIMPYGPQDEIQSHIKLLVANREIPNVDIHFVKTAFSAYLSQKEYEKKVTTLSKDKKGTKSLYGKNLYAEVELFKERIIALIPELDFDIIHAHDWMTYPAAIALSQITGKPVVLHIHNTVYDRYPGYTGGHEKEIEQMGFSNCDQIIAIAHYVKNTVLNNYDVDPNKITVVHNANLTMKKIEQKDFPPIRKNGEKIVLYAGRVVEQKGPQFFVETARLILQKRQDVKFVIIGEGSMLDHIKNQVKQYGIEDKFFILGRLYTRPEAMFYFSEADVFVMPSLSEPFGLVPFEAMLSNTPTIITKQSGISEVVKNTFLADFWDTKKMANQILGLLNYKALHKQIQENGFTEAKNMTWEKPAKEMLNVFKEVIDRRSK